MTSTQFNELVASSANPEWFNTIKEELKFKYIESNVSFTTVNSMFDFVVKQIEGWEKNKPVFPPKLYSQVSQPFQNLRSQLEAFIKKSVKQANGDAIKGIWSNEIAGDLKNIFSAFTHDCPEMLFLIKLHKEDPLAVAGAFSYIRNEFTINSIDTFRGAVTAYEFTSKGKSHIVERKELENVSLSKLKDEFQDYITESKIRGDEIVKENQKKATENSKVINDKYNEYIAAFELYKKNAENEIKEWLEQTKTNFESFNSTSLDKISELSKTYEELLRLKKPAEYWSKRASALKKEAWRAMYWLVGLVSLACLTLYILLWQTPEGMLLSFIKDRIGALKWSIVYITFISFLAYCMRAVAKIMFSSFHLSRDAEEREQLTFVYLAMVKDSSVDDKDRTLIMQSLFSRADTGLLKEDSAPTMPGNFSEKLFK